MPDEEKICEMENQFPPLSGIAFDTARKKTLEAGLNVLQSENGVIYEISPDGSRRRIKEIEPPTPVEFGLKINIR
jgi:hypothetical protein